MNISLPEISPKEDNSSDEEKTAAKLSTSTQEPALLTNEKLTFDNLLSNHLGFGLYQKYIYIIISLVAIVEGSSIIGLTLMIPVLHLEWKVPEYLNTIQISLIFVSLLLGAVFSGKISDTYGRKPPFIRAILILIIISFLSAFSPEIYTLIGSRIILGFLAGFLFPLVATFLIEVTPIKNRGRYMVLIQISLNLGHIYGILMAKSFLSSDLKSGNWRIVIIFCTIPGVIAFVLSYFFLKESPRYLLVVGKFTEAFELIDEIKSKNDKNILGGENEDINNQIETNKKLDFEQKVKLTEWSRELGKNFKDQDIASVKALFKEKGKQITPLLWFNWFTSSFVYCGIVVYMPMTLSTLNNIDSNSVNSTSNSNVNKMLISTVIEMISIFCAAFMIEIKFLGRKNSMILFYMFSSVAIMFVFIDNDDRFIIWATASKVLLSMTMIFCFQYTSEIYPTKYRTTGIGFASGFGRFATIFMPICYFELKKVSLLFPYLIFGALTIISSIVSMKLPFDTTGKDLDNYLGMKN